MELPRNGKCKTDCRDRRDGPLERQSKKQLSEREGKKGHACVYVPPRGQTGNTHG